jgi:hypothetical protein
MVDDRPQWLGRIVLRRGRRRREQRRRERHGDAGLQLVRGRAHERVFPVHVRCLALIPAACAQMTVRFPPFVIDIGSRRCSGLANVYPL